jgi:hypothetical protein
MGLYQIHVKLIVQLVHLLINYQILVHHVHKLLQIVRNVFIMLLQNRHNVHIVQLVQYQL